VNELGRTNLVTPKPCSGLPDDWAASLRRDITSDRDYRRRRSTRLSLQSNGLFDPVPKVPLRRQRRVRLAWGAPVGASERLKRNSTPSWIDNPVSNTYEVSDVANSIAVPPGPQLRYSGASQRSDTCIKTLERVWGVGGLRTVDRLDEVLVPRGVRTSHAGN
jgi:hypothetical protein